MSSVGQKSPRKAKPTFTYAIISVTMILLMVGVLGSGFFALNKAFIDLKESIEIEIELNAAVTPDEINQIKEQLLGARYINTISFQSKDEAIKDFEKEINQDIVGIAGFNPLYDAFIITLRNDFSMPDSVKSIQESIQQFKGVRSVNYSSAVIELVNANMNKAMTVAIVVIVFLLIVAFSLIDNTIRLLMFSQRFLIRSMQLIGATKWFIIKPFIIRGISAGVISAVISILLIGAGIFVLTEKYSLLELSKDDYLILSGIAGGLIVGGIGICVLSTYLSVNKYLHLKLDELY